MIFRTYCYVKIQHSDDCIFRCPLKFCARGGCPAFLTLGRLCLGRLQAAQSGEVWHPQRQQGPRSAGRREVSLHM